jgi:hypothetical protein
MFKKKQYHIEILTAKTSLSDKIRRKDHRNGVMNFQEYINVQIVSGKNHSTPSSDINCLRMYQDQYAQFK